MRDKNRFAAKLVGAGALTILLATAAVAAPAPRNGGGQWDNNRGNRQSAQQGDVYQGQRDTRGQGNYGHGQQANVHRGQADTRRQGNYGYRQPGNVYQVRVDVGRQGNYGYGYQQQGILRGVVQGINPRYGTMTIRDEATGRFVSVDMQQMNGRGAWGLRRGDFVTVYGQWEGRNTFAAYQIG